MADDGEARAVRVHAAEHHGGTAARVLHRGQRAGQPHHAEPEPAEVVPGEPGHEQRDVFGAGAARPDGVHGGRRGPSTGAGHRHGHLAVGHPAHGAVHIRRVHRLVERPDAPPEAAAPGAHHRRVGPRFRSLRLRLLLLRAAHGNRRAGRVRAIVAGRRLDHYVLGHVHVHVRHNHGECSGSY